MTQSPPPPPDARASAPDALGATAAVPAPAPAPPPSAALLLEQTVPAGSAPPRIGRYVPLRTLGEGGMGVVLVAYDEELDRKVALKVIRASKNQGSEQRGRSLREAQALARISDPNVVHVYEVGEFADQMYIAMELVNGKTLSKWQGEPGRTWQSILRMYSGAGKGLLAVHQAGLVHRDFKPDNVLIGSDDRPRVADFGLARFEHAPSPVIDAADFADAPTASGVSGVKDVSGLRADAAGSSLLTPLTQEGAVMGTPLYMSPEQYAGKPADSRSDQFSFCVALYEALYQKRPFSGKTLGELRFRVMNGELRKPPQTSKVPVSVYKALARGLAVDPQARFPSMRELLIALFHDAASDPSSTPNARRWFTSSMLGVVVVSTVGLRVLRQLGMGLLLSSLAVSLVFLLLCVGLSLRFRRSLMQNTFHRGMVTLGIALSVQFVFIRLIAMPLSLTFPQVMALDLVTLTAFGGVIAAQHLPALWGMVPLTGWGALAAAFRPELAPGIASVLVPLTITVTVLLWNRAANKKTPAAKADPRRSKGEDKDKT